MRFQILALMVLVACEGGKRGIPGGPAVSDSNTTQLCQQATCEKGADGAPGAAGRDGLGYVNGTRIKVATWRSNDGARVPKGFIDSQFANTACEPRLLGDDYRCVPAGVGVTIYFTNMECTTPALRREAAPLKQYATTGQAVTDEMTGMTFYKVGSEIMPANLYVKVGPACQAVGIGGDVTNPLALEPLDATALAVLNIDNGI